MPGGLHLPLIVVAPKFRGLPKVTAYLRRRVKDCATTFREITQLGRRFAAAPSAVVVIFSQSQERMRRRMERKEGREEGASRSQT